MVDAGITLILFFILPLFYLVCSEIKILVSTRKDRRVLRKLKKENELIM